MQRHFRSIAVALAVVVTLVVTAVLAGGRLLGIFSGWAWLAIPPIVLVVSWIVGNRLVARRVRQAIDDLRKIEQRDFEAVNTEVPGSDEISELRGVIASAGKALETEITAMKRLETYRKDFLGNVSHELKTPIFSIRGFAETLRDGALERPGVRDSFIDKIIKNADRLSNLAQDLSEIAKIETGELKMKQTAFTLRSVVSEVVDSIDPRARNKEITVRCELPPDLPKVFADEGRIRQVLSNLVENGVKYSNPGDTVSVLANRQGDHVVIEVADDGIGIAPEHQSRITERFYRVDASRSRDQGGTGLGLAIVKHILNAHGQRLELQSEVGVGSTFRFSLPLQEATKREAVAERS